MQKKNLSLLGITTVAIVVKIFNYWTGNTLLHAAARSGKKETLKLLLAHGANPKAKNTEGKTPRETTSNQDIQALLKRHSDTK
ncbi:Ankyrin [Crinalium epipsammum PCC 9333]|uniref:Ankyrin n=1 Tax=Crinalium epipsammum PCC 9333 TaxID=1173022 RepID=K9VUX6_9CYAN|nr:ankyrin repeat domain-containing protein [Crinalium epipsammum]AFZ11287.1 Ankyrin [Crinalium epipsammum PCC 9333]